MRVDVVQASMYAEMLIWRSFHIGLGIALLMLATGLAATWLITRRSGYSVFRWPPGKCRRFLALIFLPLSIALAYGQLYSVYRGSLKHIASATYHALEEQAPSDTSTQDGLRQWSVHNTIAFQNGRRFAMLVTFGGTFSVILLLLQWMIRAFGLLRLDRPLLLIIGLCLFGHLSTATAYGNLVNSWWRGFAGTSKTWAAITVAAVLIEIGWRYWAKRVLGSKGGV